MQLNNVWCYGYLDELNRYPSLPVILGQPRYAITDICDCTQVTGLTPSLQTLQNGFDRNDAGEQW